MTSQARSFTRRRLLVLASTYPRWEGDHEPGFVHELCKRLVGRFDVTVICPASRGARRSEVMDGVRVKRFRYAPDKLQSLVNDGGISTNLRRHPWKYLLVPGFLLSMLAVTVIEVLRKRADTIHAHWLLPQGAVAALVLRLLPRKARLVVTCHGADLHGWRIWPFSAVKRWALRNADLVTVVSRAMLEEVQAIAGRVAPPLCVAPMGVDLMKRFRPNHAVPRVAGRILFVGRLVEKKGLRYLIDAMPEILSRVPDAKLVIVGFGPEYDERRQQATCLGIDHAMQFMGAVPQAELPSLYRTASVFVAPFVEAEGGDREGLGLVLVEAAACGCPVVVGDVPAVHDVFEEKEACFVTPREPAAIADAVVSVLEGRANLLSPTIETLVHRFDWQGVSARYSEFLGSVEEGQE